MLAGKPARVAFHRGRSRTPANSRNPIPSKEEKFVNQKHFRVITFAFVLMMLGASQAFGQVIYDSTVTPLPGNVPSVGAEAYAFNQFGDGITFAGTSRKLVNVTLTLSSWGCQTGAWYSNDCASASGATFTMPLTVNLYNPGSPTPGSPIASRTQTVTVPYRPSVDPTCGGGRWREFPSGVCYNGKAVNVTIDFSSLNVTLPNSVVYGVAYNTTHYGPSPIGEGAACYGTPAGCPYDSLNIGLSPTVVLGTKPFFNTVYQNTPFASNYCDNGAAGTGTFRLDSPTSACWVGEVPAARFLAANPPLTKDDCKNNGWQTRTDGAGQPFPNQGQCIQYANTGK